MHDRVRKVSKNNKVIPILRINTFFEYQIQTVGLKLALIFHFRSWMFKSKAIIE